MYLSELSVVADYLNEHDRGSIVKKIIKTTDGFILALYGGKSKGVLVSKRHKMAFPLTTIDPFERKEATRIEEGIRKYVKNRRIRNVEILEEYGKVIRFDLGGSFLTVPLFGSKAIRIEDEKGTVWCENENDALEPAGTMKHIEPKVTDPLEWQQRFISMVEEESERRRLEAVKKRRKFLEKKLSNLTRDLEESTAKSTDLMDEGILLKTWLYATGPEKKMESIELYNSAGEKVTVKLDPSRSLADNMELRFTKAKKHKRGLEKIEEMIDSVREELSEIDTFEPEEAASEGPRRREKSVHEPYHTYISKRGKTYLVGKSARDNDELTLKVASPHDMWFHAKDYHGSHVILKKTKNEQLSDDDILLGCALAIQYSKASEGKEGEVWYTERKFLRKRKGMAIGMVTIERGKSRYVRLNDELMSRLEKVKK